MTEDIDDLTKQPGYEIIISLAERLGAVIEPPAMSGVLQFCRRNNFSRSFLYKLLAQGRGPKITKVGRRSFITREDEQTWRASLTTTD